MNEKPFPERERLLKVEAERDTLAAVEALPEKWKEYGRLAEAAQVATYSELRSAVYYKCARELLKALGKAKEGGG